MKPVHLLVPLWFAFSAAHATEIGIVTLADTGARFLRGVTWYKLAPGIRLEEGDIVEAPDKVQLQIEAPDATLGLIGPGSFYAVPPSVKGSPATPLLDAQGGWIKTATRAKRNLRIATPAAVFTQTEAVTVLHAEPAATALFVESGTARVTEIDGNGKEAASRDLRSGEFWSRAAAGRPAVAANRPASGFVSAMPRIFRDALPTLAARYKDRRVAPVPDRELTYGEARPWLLGPYRRDFLKRFQPRLSDNAFRAEVDAHASDHIEWD
ncbi:MAG TPA: hypothetical protein VMV45_11520, partial [Casimicrobiaceae bacterium]|nr:hypothetical protein [Casimicrobiaceae bacterium]